ncbi:hypothetical protein LOTGIDRAFT_161303 [Lottia gigantea]|uniref:Tartrate-resistant acid phosphatase type 5 n=1 Tax=Lottia gigantea TaxID=225164 RepID=V4AHD6_LOTGI|nr:hypothetical protein LOTGIDRAFT_161303 [Lottia gigantea]ESO94600.1 hypothetical protein LOTGIDRAFT_161303 [Lottia gigantea]
MGDWGGLPTFPYTTKIEKGTSDEMGVIASRYGVSFITAIGDNFYYDGVTNVSDHRFQDTFEKIYTADSLQVPWYLVAGNHDHNGNVSAEIEYTKISKRWNFPQLYYTLSFAVPGSGATVDIIMIDTVTLCGNVDDDFHNYQPTGPANVKVAEDQWEWIENSLSKSSATYLLVAGHFPVYSIAEHGPTQCLVDRLLPMLYQYKVTAYMCGHDHNLQHLQTTQDGVLLNFILSGAANFIDPSVEHRKSVPEGSSVFHWSDLFALGGFVFTEVTSSNMTFTYLDASGKQLHDVTIPPRK